MLAAAAAAGLAIGAVIVAPHAGWDLARGPLAGSALLVDGADRWILYPLEPRTRIRDVVPLEAVFEQTVEVPAGAAGDALLEVRMLGRGSVWIDGRRALTVDGDGGPGVVHRRPVGDLRGPGVHRVVARVTHDDGPPALRLRLAGEPAWELLSGEGWTASLAGAERRPVRLAAEKVHPGPRALRGEPAAGGAAWRAVGPRLAVLLLAMGLSVWAAERVGRRAAWPSRRGRGLAAAAVVALWAGLWWMDASRLPLTLGFDANGHLEYIDHLVREGSLPAADEGWQMYQPPLYYLLAAGLLRAAGATVGDPTSAIVLRGFAALLGIAQTLLLFVAASLVLRHPRLRLPEETRATRSGAELAALLFAATLPAQLALFHYVSNEILAMTLSSALAVALLATLGSAPSWRWAAAVGVVLGAGLLTKVTVAAMVPLVLAVLVWHRRRHGGGWAPAAGDALLCVGAAAALSGWHYVRLARRFGTPLVGNWDLRLGFAWWQDPGYRVPADFLTFGRSLAEPWFAGFFGVVDGVWSTLWVDGLVGGHWALRSGPPWNHPWMTVASGMAILPALALLVGLARSLARWWRGPHPVDGFLLGSVAICAAAFGWMALRIPSYAQAKAFYAHPALPAMVVFFALGAAWMLSRGPWVRRVFWVLFGVWCLTALHGFLGPPTEASLVTAGRAFLQAGDPGRALDFFDRAAALEPGSAGAQLGRYGALAAQGRRAEAQKALRRTLRLDPGHPQALRVRARQAAARNAWPRAAALIRRSLTAAPANMPERLLLAKALVHLGRPAAAEDELRRALALDPASRPLHRALLELALERGDAPVAARHLEMLRRLAPGDPRLPTLERRLRGVGGERPAEAAPEPRGPREGGDR